MEPHVQNGPTILNNGIVHEDFNVTYMQLSLSKGYSPSLFNHVMSIHV